MVPQDVKRNEEAPTGGSERASGTSEASEGEDPGDFVSERGWEEVGPIKAAIKQMEPEIKKWVQKAVVEALIRFISDYEITIDEEE